MNHYELLYLVPATYNDDELEPVKTKVKDIVTRYGGTITAENSLGKRKLAYPIKSFRQGYYLLFNFSAEPQNIKPIETEIRLTNEVLRHIIITRKTDKPSVIKPIIERPYRTEFSRPEQKFDTRVARPEEKTPIKTEPPVNLEDLDKKLDEILEGDIM